MVWVAENQGPFSAVLGLLLDCFLEDTSRMMSLAAKSETKSSKFTVNLAGCEVAGVRSQTGSGNVYFPILHGNGS